jgi:predicted TIM-barrel fold metal-dependent hydrolase
MENYRYDAHCHIFTLKYLLKDVKSMLHDMLHGTYPWHDPDSKALLSTRGNWTDLKDFLRQLYELVRASAGTEEGNLNFLQNEAGKVFPSDTLRIVPLMMDVFYMLAYPLNKDQGVVTVKSLGAVPVDEKEFQDCWNEILDDLTLHIKSVNTKLKASPNTVAPDNTNRMLQMIEDERPVRPTLQLKSSPAGTTASTGFYPTEGFCYHMNNLMDLEQKRKGELYPFIAIDPRRPGMIDALLSGSFFKGDSKFYGVKLYPRMGYHPQCAPMDAVYKYCSDNNLPIIFHCGMSGFPPGTDWKYADFGNPIHFEPVIKKYPGLKIDFAHLGSSDPSLSWAKTIVRLINENDNVYSDLACYTHVDDLNNIFPLWTGNPKLKRRLMFGTDFDVMYFTGLITMQTYYANFQSLFKADLKLLMHDNPVAFFGLNDNSYTRNL